MSAPIEVVALRRTDGRGTVKAFVDIRLGGVTIRGAKVIQQDNQRPWLGMPGIKGERGWLKTVELTKDLRARVTDVVLEAWQRGAPPPSNPREVATRAQVPDPAMPFDDPIDDLGR